ncbi:MAG: hydroxylamine reductase, partial [Candidatus Aureabacteria bacterium]|nr:hydroxylamine reductase [Candidatus Auribacterota bacterium]
MKMFCNQCEQTAGGTGCNQTGVCGKNPEVAGLQDILIHQIKQISVFAHQIRSMERIDREADRFVVEVLFTTVTNVNFDPERLLQTIREAASLQDRLQSMHSKICAEKGMPFDGTKPGLSVRIEPGSTTKELSSVAQEVSILSYDADPAMRSLKHLLLYGLKGMAAYAHHANLLGEEDESLYGFFHEALTEMNDALSAEKLFDLCIRCGQNNLKCMELLDKAHTSRFGHPEPTFVSTGLKKGPAIIVSGHDLPDLETLLEQTEGKGINVYTHGEMLPAHGYPGLKKYKHL